MKVLGISSGASNVTTHRGLAHLALHRPLSESLDIRGVVLPVPKEGTGFLHFLAAWPSWQSVRLLSFCTF